MAGVDLGPGAAVTSHKIYFTYLADIAATTAMHFTQENLTC